MRKKYFALIMTCLMCSTVIMSGCGKTDDPQPQIEEDDEDEDEDDEEDEDEDEDDGGDEEVKPDAPVIVQEIDEDTLYSQIDVFLDNRDELFFPESEDYYYTSCMVCDLDFNGRCELVLSGGSWYGSDLENRVYEIDEAGTGYYKPEYAFLGIDSEQCIEPKIAGWNSLDTYYDKKEGRFHYLMPQSLPEDSELNGFRYCDVSLKDGVIQSDTYGMYQYRYDDGYQATYFGPDDELSQDEFNDYIDSYPGDHVVKRINFGTYEGTAFYPLSDGDIETMDSAVLREILADSYRVFTGSVTDSEFVRIHSSHSSGYNDKDELLKACVGTWGLYMTDTEGSITYYEPDDEFYMILEVYEDSTMYLRDDMNTGREKDIYVDLGDYEYSPGMLYGVYYPDADEDNFSNKNEYLITDINMDGMLVLSADWWYGDEYIGGSYWYFVRLD